MPTSCGGASLRCPWAMAWPGCGARGRRRGLAGLRDDAQAHVSTPSPTGVEGAGGIGGPGCGARGRRRGLAGLRDDAQSHTSATRPHWRGGRRRDWWAWLRCRWAVAGPGRASRRRAEPDISDPAPLAWRAPEGPEGTGGLRGTAPNEVRSPSLAGGRGLRRPEHPWGTKHHEDIKNAHPVPGGRI